MKETTRTGSSADESKQAFLDNLHYALGRTLADYQAYLEAQEKVSALWHDQRAWTRASILNTARMGKFSSDRSIRDYCDRVWKIKPGQ